MALTRFRLGLALLATIVVTLPAAATAGPPLEQGGGENGTGATPVIATLVPQKQIVPVRGSDGLYHAMYELLLTSTVAKPATLNTVTVLNAESGKRVLTISRKDLVAGDLHLLDRNRVKNTTLPAGESRVLFVSVSFDSRKAIPRHLVGRFQLSGLDVFTGKTERFDYRAGAVAISRRKPPVLSPPLRGGDWLASDGCCTAAGHVSAIYGLDGTLQAAERYAIDWIEVAPDGRIYHGDPAVLKNWVGYGAPVYSASAGKVIVAKDGLPDQTPLVKPGVLPLDDLAGNNVVVEMKSGLSVVYAHLVPGSLAVRVGQRVSAGQELGRLGNSGGSLAPHLHFHVVNGTSAATSDGYPFVFDSFELAASSDLGALGEALEGKPGFPTAAELKPVARHDVLPLGFTIDEFPR